LYSSTVPAAARVNRMSPTAWVQKRNRSFRKPMVPCWIISLPSFQNGSVLARSELRCGKLAGMWLKITSID